VRVEVPLAVGTLSLDLPPGWQLVDEPPAAVALLAVAPGGSSAVRPNVVVTVDDVSGLDGLRDWQEGSDRLMAGALTGYHLLDLERLTLAGVDGVRRLAHHVTGDATSVTLEQWAFVLAGQGVTLTGTGGTDDYPDVAPAFRACAETLEVR
jgi:hypothetical protein